MKIFQKQLILIFLFFTTVFVVAGYFYIIGLNRTVAELATPYMKMYIDKIKTDTRKLMKTHGLKNKWDPKFKKTLLTYFIENDVELRPVTEFWIFKADSQIVFSRNPLTGSDGAFAGLTGTDNAEGQFNDNGIYTATWSLNSKSSLRTAMLIDSHYYINDALHDVTIHLYLVGFAGILGTIFIAMAATRIMKSPLKLVHRAMNNIDKRKYGYRIKSRRGDEFKEVYEKVNVALTRLEQLDSVQRTAVQRRNNLARELKTFSRFMDIMAHEVKNPLHALVINIDVLRSKIEKGRAKAESIKHVDIIEKEIEHLKEVIGGFLSYVRPGVPQKERSNINRIVKEVCQMVSAEANKSSIKIESRLSKGLKDVSIDRGQLQQALLNILVNAIHASSAENKILVRTLAKGKKIMVSVKDTGVGISREELKRIFDLYFTTKKEGSGIGLPVTKRIIEANGGQMQLESKVGKGTTVTLSFNSI